MRRKRRPEVGDWVTLGSYPGAVSTQIAGRTKYIHHLENTKVYIQFEGDVERYDVFKRGWRQLLPEEIVSYRLTGKVPKL